MGSGIVGGLCGVHGDARCVARGLFEAVFGVDRGVATGEALPFSPAHDEGEDVDLAVGGGRRRSVDCYGREDMS